MRETCFKTSRRDKVREEPRTAFAAAMAARHDAAPLASAAAWPKSLASSTAGGAHEVDQVGEGLTERVLDERLALRVELASQNTTSASCADTPLRNRADEVGCSRGTCFRLVLLEAPRGLNNNSDVLSRSSSINDAACAAADVAPSSTDAVLETDDCRDANSTILRSAGDAGDAADPRAANVRGGAAAARGTRRGRAPAPWRAAAVGARRSGRRRHDAEATQLGLLHALEVLG